MDAVFVKLFNMSVAAGWLILIVLILRLLLRRAPHRIHCLLWGIVAIRLICPVSLQSALSLIPSAETVRLENVRYGKPPEIKSGIPAVNRVVNPVIEETFSPDAGDSVNPLDVLVSVAGIVWLTGAAVFLVCAFISYVRLRRQVREAALISDRVWECDHLHTPFILGVIRPRIYLPSGMDGEAAEYVLAHERAHLRRRDQWWKLIGYVLLAVYWFHPLVWIAYLFFCRDVEMACDEQVIRSLDMDGKKAYSKALLSVSIHRRKLLVCPLAFGEVGVKERIKSVLSYRKPAVWLIGAALGACIIVAVCFLTDPKETEIYYNGYWLDVASLSDESVKWLHWYNRLGEEEQMGVEAPDEVWEQYERMVEKQPEEDDFRARIERAAGEPIREFFCADLNYDGKNEAVAVTAQEAEDEPDSGYQYASMWYASDETCECFYDGSGDDAGIYPDTIGLYDTEGTMLFCCVKGWGGSGRYAQAWMFDADGAKKVENVMEGISPVSERQFAVMQSGWDGSVDGTGHTQNQYYSFWDGTKLVEYGGLEISEEQLLKAKNAPGILKAVKETYGTVQSIYYRDNGMVFINLCDGSLNRNVSLELRNGVLDYAFRWDGMDDAAALEHAAADGIIAQSVTSCVSYPEEFPLDGELKEHVMLTYELDEPYEMPATLYRGDGFLIYLPDTYFDFVNQPMEGPVRLEAGTSDDSPECSMKILCYEGKTVPQVEKLFQENGFAYDSVWDTGGTRMQKEEPYEEGYKYLLEARLYSEGSDVWVIHTKYLSAYDVEGQLCAIIDTFQVVEN